MLPSDATQANPALSGIPLETVKEYMCQSRASKRVLILDSCHSGSGRDVTVMGKATAQALDTSEGLVTLASCSLEESSYEWKDKGHGTFSYFIADGLRGNADVDEDGLVLASELNRYVYESTRRWAAGRGMRQHPKYVSAVQGDIVLVGVPPRGAQQIQVTTPAQPAQPMSSGQPWQRPSAQAGEEIIGPHGGAMVWVPPGSFMMGSTQEQIDIQWTQHGWDETWKQYAEREQPAHMVQSDGFWIGKTEVTVGEWRSVMGNSPGSANALGDDYPVVEVSWTDCAGFCERSGLSLPTEAQWEYAARGAEGRLYPWGDEWDATFCRNRENGASGKSVFPVGSFPGGVSWCGAQDMAGNVWEWCADWFGNYDGHGAQVNPVGPLSGTGRVVRGGGWSNDAVNCRSTTRITHPPGESRAYYGFRVVANVAAK